MKKSISLILFTVLAAAALAAPPAPPSGTFVSGLTTTPSTNAVSAPVGFFPVALVYSPATILKPAYATAFQWNSNTETNLAGYNAYFGDLVNTNVFAKLTVSTAVNAVVFLNLSTNTVYGFYATAFNTLAQESAPSALVVLKPGTP